MSRLENQKQAGFFPLPNEVGEMINTHFTAPIGGRILDPCAGEGIALVQIAKPHHLVPYAVELNKDRAKTAKFHISLMMGKQARLRHVIADDYRNMNGSKNAFNVLFENPPYMFVDNRLDGRAEYQWLRGTRPYLQPGGLLIYVVPIGLLRHDATARYLDTWFDQMLIYRFPDETYERFKQIVVFGVRKEKADTPNQDRIHRMKSIGRGETPIPILGYKDEPFYTVPGITLPDERFAFRGLFVDPQEAVAEAATYGLKTKSDLQEHFAPNSYQVHLDPLTPMKIGHLTGVIAAGHINNQVLADGNTRLLIKGHSHKTVVTTQATEDREGGYVEKTFHTQAVVTNITTVDKDGNIEQHAGPQLNDFLSCWIEPLTQVVTKSYPPRYTFDLNGFGDTLNKLNMTRKIPILNRPGLLPAQKHAAAAAATRLETHDDALIIGEMGTGKTLMATSTIAALQTKMKMKHAIILCPPHLTLKWAREIKATWPKARTIILEKRSDVDRFFADAGPIIGVMKETTARAASGWHHSVYYNGPATLKRRQPREKVRYTRRPTLLKPHGEIGIEDGDMRSQMNVNRLVMRRRFLCPSCGQTIRHPQDDSLVAAIDFTAKKMFCPQCKGALHQDSRRPDNPDGSARYPLATYIKRHYKKKLDLLIADEAHEYKGADSDRGYAFHRLATAARKVLALTGTIYGGKASTLFYLLYRMSPDVRKAYTDTSKTGLKRLMVTKWVNEYGILQEIETRSYDESGKQSGNSKDKRQIKELPGASPAMLPWLLNNAIFVSLKDMGFALPEYEEIPIAVEMTEDMKNIYSTMDTILREELRKRLLVDDKSLLGAYLQTLLTWPDSPWRAKGVTTPKGEAILKMPPMPQPPGYYPKERAILDLIKEEKAQGRRCVLMCQQTNLLDITPQWMQMLEENGLKGAVLKADPKKREAWIDKQADAGVDVIITHPRKVQTGLDLLDYPTIIWMGTEYSIYTVLQASRRAWRIGQAKKCKVYYFVYEDTLQERALKLIASKIAAAVRVNGDTVEADSLADMDEYASADIVTALSKMLMEEIDFTEEMKEVNKAYEEALAGNLTYSHKYTFAGTGYDKGAIRKRYAAYAKKVHPDVAEQPDRKVESLNDIFAKANAAFQADDQFVGDFKIEDDFVPEPEPATAEPPPVQEPPKPVMRRMTLGSMTFGEAAQLFERKKRRARPVSELQMSLFG